MFWRYLPLAGIVLIVLIAGCLRPWLQLRRHGTFGILLFRSGRPAQTLRDALLVLLVALLIGQALVVIARPRAQGLLVAGLLVVEQNPIHDILQVAGAILMLGGIAFLVVAQLNLGASWRIGIDEGAAPGMVSGGLYRFCRHPIYLGLLTATAGYAALLPTPLSLALLLGAYAGARAQAAAEEAYLLRTYGKPYRDYAREVGRFLPGVGRL